MKFPHMDFSRVLPPVLLALAVANFVLACHVGRQNYPTVIKEVLITTNVVASSSSDIPFLGADTNGLSAVLSGAFTSSSVPSPTNLPSQVCETSYQYFVVGRRIGCKMFGRFYYEGSPCSYGRISEIYPDRILLASGDWITNLQRFHDGFLDNEKEFKR